MSEQLQTTHFYTDGGALVDSDNDKVQYCKSEEVSTKAGIITKFYIRCGKGGYYNPWGLYSENNASQVDTHTKRPLFPFREVPQTVFDEYMAFIKTRREQHLIRLNRQYDGEIM